MQRSEFIGFDMLAEPPPRWPDWLERWFSDPHRGGSNIVLGTSSAALSAAISRVFSRQALEDELLSPGSFFRVPINTPYRTPRAIERRVAQRAAKRMPRD